MTTEAIKGVQDATAWDVGAAVDVGIGACIGVESVNITGIHIQDVRAEDHGTVQEPVARLADGRGVRGYQRTQL